MGTDGTLLHVSSIAPVRRPPNTARALVGLLQLRMVAGDSGVHCIRRQIDLSRPRNRAAINEDLLEELHVTQGCEDTG